MNVRSIGAGRLRVIPGAGAGFDGLGEWLSRRPEVSRLDTCSSAALVVCTAGGAAAQRSLRRALRERVTAVPAAGCGGAPSFSVRVVHTVAGRVRLRACGLDAGQLRSLAAWLSSQPGVQWVKASADTGSLVVGVDPLIVSGEDLRRAVLASDPSAWPAVPAQAEAASGPDRSALAFTSALLAVSALKLAPAPLVVVGIAAASVPCAQRAFETLRRGRVGVDALDFSAIVLSASTGLHTTAAFMAWLLSIGDHILAHTTERARAAISEVLTLDASEAWVLRGAVPERVAATELAPGDRIVVDAGARIAADGVVVEGVAMVDEKALTGEPLPAEKRAGSRVLAATVVVEGQVIVRVDRTGESTTAARIVRILEGTGAKPMSLQREIEKRADWLALPTIGVAVAAAALSGQIGRMTSCLITDFGTGVRIAIPTAVLATMTLAAREGVLVKGGHYLERLHRADVVVFDKTGTLTSGSPRVVRIRTAGQLSERELLALAAGAEARQKHPVAAAICACAVERGVVASPAEVGSESYTIGVGLSARVAGREVLVGSARLLAGRGIAIPAEERALAEQAPGTSRLFVAVDGRFEGSLEYADEIRGETPGVIGALRAGDRREIVLLSGDAAGAVREVAGRVGIDRAIGGLLPEEKVHRVREMQAGGRTVAMVGDGINDAPALALSEVGISLDGATDVALEVADVVLLSGGLSNLPRAFDAADQAMARVQRGVALVIAPNVAAMLLGAFGLLPPGLAAFVNNGSTVVAALASAWPLLRARRAKKERRRDR